MRIFYLCIFIHLSYKLYTNKYIIHIIHADILSLSHTYTQIYIYHVIKTKVYEQL